MSPIKYRPRYPLLIIAESTKFGLYSNFTIDLVPNGIPFGTNSMSHLDASGGDEERGGLDSLTPWDFLFGKNQIDDSAESGNQMGDA